MLQASACTCTGAAAGNAFVGEAAMDWFRGLTAPGASVWSAAQVLCGSLAFRRRHRGRRSWASAGWSMKGLRLP